MTHQLLWFASGFVVDVVRLALWLVLLVAIFVPLEHLFGEPSIKIWRRQTGVDLVWYFVNSLLPAAILSVPLALLSRALQGVDPGGFYSVVAAWPFGLKMFLVLLVNDIGAYWGHRALHAHRWLWRFHAVHHSAEEMDWLVNTRAHPFDMVFVRFSGLAPVYLLGLAQTTGARLDPAVAVLTIFGTLWTFFIHSNMRVRLGPLEWLISSPAFHHWHHTRDDHRDHNFSFVFPVIDRVFGTAWLPRHWPSAYGINAKLPPTVTGQFLAPLGPARRPAKNDQNERAEAPVLAGATPEEPVSVPSPRPSEV